ncbi:SDR family NAD(P)-dependent oxidoreductase [Salipiger mucosus]|uniref:3-oxoacyl-[acyl-carrier protein] reductase n=1 Tax=Salipiger mucosus DSM 16094 TaxID=1123237 RepID=S9R1F2_9RHOB|nr:SDR family NAD(P)-dependent oxidoreductase [Salipiger mucosus]EPX85717.1 3-oxoacyl-[acyl-carrier protein] reductase [Salipiger mucosus DSM 16094]
MLTFAEGTAFVTGGGSGIGQATAIMLAAAGVPVAVADIDGDGVTQTVTRIEAEGGAALGLALDVTDRAAVDAAFDKVEAWKGAVTILVNSAGILRVEPFEDFTTEDFETVMSVNVTGSFHCAQRAAAGMKAKGYGRIVNLSSVSGYRAGVGRTAYGTSKAAIAHLTRQIALELGRSGITANAIAPGTTMTKMTAAAYTEENKANFLKMIPSGFIAEPEDIAPSIIFLASEQARYVNGHTMPVDGGYLASGMTQTAGIEV